MELNTTVRDDILVVAAVAERLDAATAIQFRTEFDEIRLKQHAEIVLDLSRIRFMDSSGAWAITHVCKAASRGGTGLKLVNAEVAVLRVLRSTGIARFLDIHETLRAALGPTSAQSEKPPLFTNLKQFARLIRRSDGRSATGSQTA